MSKNTANIAFLFIFVFATVLRFYHINNYGIFGDEKQGIMVAVGNVNIGGKKALMAPDKTFTPRDFWQPKTIAELLDANARGDTSGNATVHLITMNVFGHLFGHSDGALRSVSAIYNLLTILFIFLIGRNIFKNDKIALIAAFLAATEPFYIIFSQQARFYTTCIFFGTMASYYFLQIMVNGKSTLKYYAAYTVSIILTIFSNYLTFTVFLVHGLYWLIADRTWLKLRSFMICYGIMAIPFGFWMTKGPGQYALLYIKDATNLYNSILKNPKLAASYQGFIDLASAKNLFIRGTSIVSDYFIFTNGWYEKFGNKIAFLLVIGFLLVVTFVVLQKAKKSEYQLFTFVVLIVFIPFVFSVVSAYKAGVMTGFYFRYTSFGLPFVSILMAWFLVKMFENHKILFTGFAVVLLIQFYSFAKIIKHFYADGQQKYTSSRNRGANPYIMVADKIKSMYMPGDTIVYPSVYANGFSKAIDRPKGEFDNHDAQLVNLYLPKDATYIQRIAFEETDRVLLRRNGQTFVLFNFEGMKYRY